MITEEGKQIDDQVMQILFFSASFIILTNVTKRTHNSGLKTNPAHDKIFEFLQDNDFDVGIYHTNMDLNERINFLREYRNGTIKTLVTCKALDEGLDVPNTNVGVIVASTSSIRQHIQRMGRILRRAPGKKVSEIYTIYTKGIEDDIFGEEELSDIEHSAYSIETIEMGLSVV